jgi:hypothetical protein
MEFQAIEHAVFDIHPYKVGSCGGNDLEGEDSVCCPGCEDFGGDYLRHKSAWDSMSDTEQRLFRIFLSLTQSFAEIPWIC